MLQSVQFTVALTLLLTSLLVILRKRNKKIRQTFQKNKSNENTPRLKIEQLREIAEKLDLILKEKKMYTNPELSINDVAEMLGTNRTYVSTSINIFYNQNFCTYINQFRLNEVKETLIEEGKVSQKELAEKCGFGSIDTMKRAVKQKTGLNMKDWKEFVCKECLDNNNSN
jgi:AraC-like DNA-binding protein